MAAGAERELTHDELWDDSALVESWNEALEEYQVRNIIYPRNPTQDTNSQNQKYHSIAARGEKVPVIDMQPKRPAAPSKAAPMLNGTRPAPQAREETPEDVGPSPMTTLPGNFIGPAAPPKPSNTPAAAPAAATVPANLADMPQAMIGASKSLRLL